MTKYISADYIKELYKNSCGKLISSDGKPMCVMSEDEFDKLLADTIGTEMIPEWMYERDIQALKRKIFNISKMNKTYFVLGAVAGILCVAVVLAMYLILKGVI